MFNSWRKRRAAKRYAGKLGARLVRSFGASETYTPGQIDRGVRELKLDARYIAFGYAVFLDEETFNDLAPALPVTLRYEEARSIVRRYASGHFAFNPNTKIDPNLIYFASSNDGLDR